MAPVCTGERQRKWRALLKENGKYNDYKKRNAAYNRKCNEKKKNEFKNLFKHGFVNSNFLKIWSTETALDS